MPGYISEITAAACVPLNGQQDCFTADELWQVAETADPAALGVVEWAADGVRAAPDPRKRLEGMILPGDFDIPPGSTPEQALQGGGQRVGGAVERHRHHRRLRGHGHHARTRRRSSPR